MLITDKAEIVRLKLIHSFIGCSIIGFNRLSKIPLEIKIFSNSISWVNIDTNWSSDTYHDAIFALVRDDISHSIYLLEYDGVSMHGHRNPKFKYPLLFGGGNIDTIKVFSDIENLY